MRILLLLFLGLPIAQAIDDAVLENRAKKYPQVFESFNQDGAAGKIAAQFPALLKQGGVETENAYLCGMEEAVEQIIKEAGKYGSVVRKMLKNLQGMSPDEMDAYVKEKMQKLKSMKVPQEKLDILIKAYEKFRKKLDACNACGMEEAVEQIIQEAGRYGSVVRKMLKNLQGMSADEMDAYVKEKMQELKSMEVPQEKLDILIKAYEKFREKLDACNASAEKPYVCGMEEAVEQIIKEAGRYGSVVRKMLKNLQGMSPDEMDAYVKEKMQKLKSMEVPQEKLDILIKAYEKFREKLDACNASAEKAADTVSVDNSYRDNKDNNSGIGGKTRVPIYGDMSAGQLFRIFFRRVLIESTA